MERNMLDESSTTNGPVSVPQAPRSGNGLSVQVIETYDSFRKLKPLWTDLQTRDPEMTVFLGWSWLDRAFRDNPGRWRVFVVRASQLKGAAVAIFPVMMRAGWNDETKQLETQVMSGGRLILSEYTGLLCDPAHEEGALALLARTLSARPWAALSLVHEISPARAARFAAAFDPALFEATDDTVPPETLIRPVLPLPDSYETWLQSGPRPHFRQRIRRFGRRYLSSGARRITVTDAESFARDASVLIDPKLDQWREAHGLQAARQMAGNLRAVLANALKTDALFMAVLWEGDTALGALAHVLDHEMDRVHVLMGSDGGDPESGSVGMLLHSESIRWAISHGFASYDFGRGTAPYKAGFGAHETAAAAITIRRKDTARHPAFDRMTLGDGIRRVSTLLNEGQADAARDAAAQLARLVR